MVTEEQICRICYCSQDPITDKIDLISPCNCKGSVKYVHKTCLKYWRFKGKKISDIQNCEQCKGEYFIEGEWHFKKSSIIAITIFLFIISSFILHIVLSTVINSFSIVIADITENPIFIKSQIPETINFNTFSTNISNISNISNIDIFYLAYIMAIISTYNIFIKKSNIATLNYVFTFWRLHEFGFFIDKIIFAALTIHFSIGLFKDLYGIVDTSLYYIMNK